MAKMIPHTIHPSVKSSAEKRLFRLFKDAPGTENWIILHSLGLSRHQTKRRSEIDFLILCDRGVFILEVKGGRMSREEGVWYTQDRFNQYSRLHESPFEQASSAMFALEKDIRLNFGKSHPLSKVLIGYGVMFPSTNDESIELGTDGDRNLTYFFEDTRQPISRFVGRIATFFESKSPSAERPTLTQLSELVDFLRGDFDLIPPLWINVIETEDQLLELTKEQYRILDVMIGRPRVIIRGAAGTGKTELARREALTAAMSRKRTLFLCYNRLLAAKLRSDPVLNPYSEHLKISSIYQFMDELIRQSSFAEEFSEKRQEVDVKNLYGSLYPEYTALTLLESEENLWDFIVVDEGQDLVTERILDLLELCLVGGLESGNWRWFMDDNNQASVYGVADISSISRLEQYCINLQLTVNCRNTRQIHEETRMMTNPKIQAVAKVDGRPVRYAWYSNPKNQIKTLEKQLNRLALEGVNSRQVVILSAVSLTKSVVRQLPIKQVEELDETILSEELMVDKILYSTVSAFKGLEAYVVILTDINEFESDWWKSVLYVGMSRAKVELVILLPEKLKTAYNQKLRDMLENIEDEE